MLYHYTLFPLEKFLSILLSLLHGVTGSYLLALILLSIVVRLITTPLEKLANKSVVREHDICSVLAPQIAQIKAKVKGEERHEAIKRLYARYSYHPVYAVRSMFGLLVQLPFFIAAFYMIGESTVLQGVVVPFVGDLSQQDRLLFDSINLLPFIMTGVNLSALYTTPNFNKKDSIQGACIALLFLVLLYNSPSALLIYWAVNQAGSLIGNIIEKFPLKQVISRQVTTNIFISFVFSVTFFSTILFFKPFAIYLMNSQEFSGLNMEIASELCGNLFLLVACSTLFLAIILSFFKKYRAYLLVLCVALAIGAFFQGNILQWNYGLLDGKNIPWGKFWYRGIIDLSIWLGIFGFCLKYRDFLQRKIVSIFCVIIIFQTLIFTFEQHNILFTPTTTSEVKNASSFRYKADPSQQFIFSKEKNIIVLVFDGYRERLFKEVLAEMPELKKELDGFTQFTDMLGVGGYTFYSTPTYLGTGTPYLNKQSHSQYLLSNFSGKNTFFRKMVADNWTTGVYYRSAFRPFLQNPYTPLLLTDIIKLGEKDVQQTGDTTKLIKVSIFSSSPQYLKQILFSFLDIQNIWTKKIDYTATEKADVSFTLPLLPDVAADLRLFNAMQNSFKLRERGAAFKYFHTHGLHRPQPLIDRNFKKVANTSQLEIGLVDAKLMLRLIHMLKFAEIYDNTQLYIMGDHGQYPITSSVDKAKQYIKNDYPKNSQPLFLFKDFSGRGVLKKNHTPLSFKELPQMIYDLSKSTGGKNSNSIIDKFERTTRFFYTFSNMNGEYFPVIIEAQVDGDSHKPTNWSLTGNTYSAVKNIKPLSDNSYFLFKKFMDYGGYVTNGIIGGGTKTRGSVDFTLPLDKTLYGSDIKITMKIAARADVKTNSRTYEICVGQLVLKTGRLVAPDYESISFVFPSRLIESGIVKFTLKSLNLSSQRDINTGQKMHGGAFLLNKLSVRKVALTSYQEEKILSDANYGMVRLRHLKELNEALEHYHSKYGFYPRSQGFDGFKTRWGKSSKNWIPGLVPEFLSALPRDPQLTGTGRKEYLYKSNGKDFKLIAHNIILQSEAEKKLQDPKRPTFAFGYWSLGAKNW